MRINELFEDFKSKQEVINYFVKQGRSAAAGAAAWERGWRVPSKKKTTRSLPPPHWMDRERDD